MANEQPTNANDNATIAKVLLIEDDRFLRELIAQKLEKEKFDVMQTVDGESGLRKLSEQKPDIVLLDLILPGMSGFEVLKKIREMPDSQTIPVVILSNLGQREDVEKGLSLGATDFLIKAHFTPGEIITKIKNVLSTKR
ncbi:MAG: hypothetical protein A3A80_02180 [Candidatus Terrybacteria bacterium RIFCSPLOWO2_01_FULL_44_24]|uniref:Response regulatory domain-containing protein n=1 Tax=Candidatus Terrybacteria bacterium RIFCSPHIGHO2_01_FULL_43_35 TaxID=1802361 RepID=A0A1G2PE79_9BACT|nr:MAG: hypothetical protein A2828_01970 [Candidatus Terrybacteria bacterium RIFCSPHIGHO2_01_FULL_43_35]OHA50888.1 MAG: hypothetical protein A3A80_02180 [Candidatus Terrybacteria bacterium RIFCSPLOWO2_01_FULL_44_24]